MTSLRTAGWFLIAIGAALAWMAGCGDDWPAAFRVSVVDGGACIEITEDEIRAVPCTDGGAE